MTQQEIKSKLKSEEYSFLKENPHLDSNVILLTLAGSHAYGTNVEGSDLDIRGCATNSVDEILLGNDFSQVCDNATDTTIYSFNKLVKLLSNANPNIIEMLGTKEEHRLYVSPIGQELINHSHLFLSKLAVNSFGGYATQQLRRLSNKTVREESQSKQEQHILNSIQTMLYSFKEKYSDFEDGGIMLYRDEAVNMEMETEIFMDINLTHYPLRDYKNIWSEMKNVVKDYSKIGKRNKNAATHDKLGKHMMHLIRLHFMCLDILERQEIITYREKEHSLLMDIRNEKFLDREGQPIKEFYDMVDDLEDRIEKAAKTTSLPDKPNYEKIREFQMGVNEKIIRESM
ncbi:putative nucleotidyltransferase [Lachnospiraceae bacterium PF1-22]